MLPSQFDKITSRAVIAMILNRLDTGSVGWVNSVAMRITSDQASEEYAWLGNSPALREFLGGRQPAELAENSFRISNRDYEGSIKIKSKDMRRDKTGQIQIRANQLADRATDHPAKLLSALIIAGESTTCYDGQYFFDTDHSEGASGSQSNDISVDISTLGTTLHGTTTAPSAEEIAECILLAIQQIVGLKDDRGEPMNASASEFLVMVPTSLMGPALKAVTLVTAPNGGVAVLPGLSGYFKIAVAVNPRLTWTDKFAVFRTDEAAKPFILQQEGEPDVMALGEGSEYEQLHKEQLYGVDWAGNVGYGYWQHACLVTMT